MGTSHEEAVLELTPRISLLQQACGLRLESPMTDRWRVSVMTVGVVVCSLVGLSSWGPESFGAPAGQAAGTQPSAQSGEWRYYGGDAGSTKYSPLDQINKQN